MLWFGKQHDVHLREILQGSALVFVLKVFGAGMGFLLSVVLARLLGTQGTGEFFLVLSIITILSVIARVGLDNALVRFVASESSAGNGLNVRTIYRYAISTAGSTSLVLAVVAYVGADWLAHTVFGKPELSDTIRALAPGVVPLSLLMLHAEMLRGLKRVGWAQLVKVIGIPTITVTAIILAGDTLVVDRAATFYLIALGSTFVIAILLWRILIRGVPDGCRNFQSGLLIDSCLPLYGVALLALAMNWMATILLGVWWPSDEVGIFSAANRTAMLTSFILTSVNAIAAPKFSVLYVNDEIDALGATARMSAAMMTIFASPILIVLIFFPAVVMRLFGDDFAGGAVPLAILAIGQFVNVSCGSVGLLLMMTGREKLLRSNSLRSVVVYIVLCVALIPSFAAIGAAIATAVGLALFNVLCVFSVWRTLGISLLPAFLRRSQDSH